MSYTNRLCRVCDEILEQRSYYPHMLSHVKAGEDVWLDEGDKKEYQEKNQ